MFGYIKFQSLLIYYIKFIEFYSPKFIYFAEIICIFLEIFRRICYSYNQYILNLQQARKDILDIFCLKSKFYLLKSYPFIMIFKNISIRILTCIKYQMVLKFWNYVISILRFLEFQFDTFFNNYNILNLYKLVRPITYV